MDDNTQNIIVFSRYAKDGSSVVYVGNFSPEERKGYEIGVDKRGGYAVVLNSDLEVYGGRTKTLQTMTTKDETRHGKEQSISIDIPANASLFIKLVKEERDEDEVIVDDSDDGSTKKRPAKKPTTKKTTKK